MCLDQLNSDFHNYYSENWRLTYYAAYEVLGNSAAAEDVAHDVFTKLYEYMLNGHPPIAKIHSWLAVSAKRRAYNYIRDNKRFTSLDTEFSINDSFENAENRIFTSDMLNRLYNRNERWFDIIDKYYILEMSTKEIASEYGCSEQAIRNTLHRAIEYLRKEYRLYDVLLLLIYLLLLKLFYYRII